MKKLLAIMVLGLLSACSNKVDKAIEKCADFQIISESNTYLRNQFKSLVLNNPSYKDTIEQINELKKIQYSTNANYEIEYNKWIKNNPRPKIPTYDQVQKGYTFPKYKKLIKEWREADEIITSSLLNPWTIAKKKIENLKENQIAIIKISAREILKNKSLKEKSLMNKYNKNFEKCEKAQKQAPKSFMLEWSK